MSKKQLDLWGNPANSDKLSRVKAKLDYKEMKDPE